jgi:hypothetical protein
MEAFPLLDDRHVYAVLRRLIKYQSYTECAADGYLSIFPRVVLAILASSASISDGCGYTAMLFY